MIENLKIFVGKIWQTKDYKLCFQIKDQNYKNKTFLILDTKSKLTPIYFSKEKPSNCLAQGNITSLLRKHLEGKILGSILKRTTEPLNLWVLFRYRGSEKTNYYLKMTKTPLLECSLISPDKKVLFRYGTKGSFTHVKSYDEALVEENLENFKSLYETLIKKLEETKEKEKLEDTSLLKQKEVAPNNNLRKQLKRRLKTLKQSKEKVNSIPITRDSLKKEQTELSLLKEHLYLAEQTKNFILLPAEASEQKKELKFEIDSKISQSLGKNLSLLFKKLDKKQSAYEHKQERLKIIEKDILSLMKDLENIALQPLTDQEHDKILNQNKIKKQEKQTKKKVEQVSVPYKLFTDKNKVRYYVGKTASDNDKLVKTAKSNDLWFHVSGSQGSHVIIPNSCVKRKSPLEDIKRFAGTLALYYSKAKQDQKGEVYFSKRHLLKKGKHQAPGLWTVTKSETFFVSFTDNELKVILDQMTK